MREVENREKLKEHITFEKQGRDRGLYQSKVNSNFGAILRPAQ